MADPISPIGPGGFTTDTDTAEADVPKRPDAERSCDAVQKRLTFQYGADAQPDCSSHVLQAFNLRAFILCLDEGAGIKDPVPVLTSQVPARRTRTVPQETLPPFMFRRVSRRLEKVGF